MLAFALEIGPGSQIQRGEDPLPRRGEVRAERSPSERRAAQPAAPRNSPPTRSWRRRARFKAAEAAKVRGDYKTAATEYLAVHELFPDPEFFFDIGEVYRAWIFSSRLWRAAHCHRVDRAW